MLASDLPFVRRFRVILSWFSRFDGLASRYVSRSLKFLRCTYNPSLKVSVLWGTYFRDFQILAVGNLNLIF